MINNQLYFNSLTGLRAVAAYMVFLHHYNPIPKVKSHTFLYQIFQEFHIGVTFFFVLSGFLITHRYYKKENFNFRAYIINRITRIFPVYFFLTSITYLIKYFRNTNHQNSFFKTEYLLNISMLKGFFNDLKFTGIAQGWSLTVEETFYISAPFFFVLIAKNLKYLIILPFLIVCIGIILVVFFLNYDVYGFFIDFNFLFGYTFFGRSFEFFTGIFIAICLTEIKLPAYKYFTYTGFIGIVLSCVLLILFKGSYEFGVQSPVGRVINSLILPCIGLFFFYIGLIKENSIISKILGSNFMGLLGKSSYVFYLIHMGFIYDFIEHKTQNNFFTFLLLILISIIIFKLIEDPLNNLLKKIIKNSSKNLLTK